MSNKYLNYDWTPVINFETGGINYYNKFLKSASWPGGQSGITIGIGADLGYLTENEFDAFFQKCFTPLETSQLKSTIGLKGFRAKAQLSSVKAIKLEWEDASDIFIEWTLPKFWKLTNSVWPGTDQLCEKAQIALVSIVFNRGSSLKGPSRREMLHIRHLVSKQDYSAIAEQVRSMKRLWENKGQDGLIKRREEEAKLIESCI